MRCQGCLPAARVSSHAASRRDECPPTTGTALRVAAAGPVAKARPRKATLLTAIARAAGLREADLRAAGWALAVAALLLAVLGLWNRSD